jgi:hypothetical protein
MLVRVKFIIWLSRVTREVLSICSEIFLRENFKLSSLRWILSILLELDTPNYDLSEILKFSLKKKYPLKQLDNKSTHSPKTQNNKIGKPAT